MSMRLRDMRPEETDRIAAMVAGLARDVGAAIVPQLTGDKLNAARDIVDVIVAEEDGTPLGVILTLMTFSTWRGARGLYVVDLFVEGAARNRRIGLALLREAARRGRAKGARFVKLEVDHTNLGAARFYRRLGFTRKEEDRLFVLEQDRLETFIADKELP